MPRPKLPSQGMKPPCHLTGQLVKAPTSLFQDNSNSDVAVQTPILLDRQIIREGSAGGTSNPDYTVDIPSVVGDSFDLNTIGANQLDSKLVQYMETYVGLKYEEAHFISGTQDYIYTQGAQSEVSLDRSWFNPNIQLQFHNHPRDDVNPRIKGNFEYGIPSDSDLIVSLTYNSYQFAVIGPLYIVFYKAGVIQYVYNGSGQLIGNDIYYSNQQGSRYHGEYKMTPGQSDYYVVKELNGALDIYSLSSDKPGSGGQGQTDGIEITKQTSNIFLIDDRGGYYLPSMISFARPYFTNDDGSKRMPKIGIMDEKGTITKPGSKLLIGFLEDNYFKPIILDCIENAGAQHYLPNYNMTDFNLENNEIDINKNDDFEIHRSVNENGDTAIRIKNKTDNKARYTIHIEGKESVMIHHCDGDYMAGNNSNYIHFTADKIYIGRNNEYEGKASEIGLNGKKIYLGTSTFDKDDLAVDGNITANSAIGQFNAVLLTDAKFQPAVLASACAYILRRIMEIWSNAKYPNGLVSADDKGTMEQLKTLIPKILSESVMLINKSFNPYDTEI